MSVDLLPRKPAKLYPRKNSQNVILTYSYSGMSRLTELLYKFKNKSDFDIDLRVFLKERYSNEFADSKSLNNFLSLMPIKIFRVGAVDPFFDEFSGFNDGHRIPAEKCKIVAKLLEDNFEKLNSTEKRWLKPHINLWKFSGGFSYW